MDTDSDKKTPPAPPSRPGEGTADADPVPATAAPDLVRDFRPVRRLRGYERGAVDDLLRRIATSLGEAERDLASLRRRVSRLEEEDASRRELERAVRDTLVDAHAESEAIREGAFHEAEDIVRAAEHEAAGIGSAGVQEREASEREIERLRALEGEVRDSVRLLLAGALTQIEPEAPAAQAPVEVSEPAEGEGETEPEAERAAEAPALEAPLAAGAAIAAEEPAEEVAGGPPTEEPPGEEPAAEEPPAAEPPPSEEPAAVEEPSPVEDLPPPEEPPAEERPIDPAATAALPVVAADDDMPTESRLLEQPVAPPLPEAVEATAPESAEAVEPSARRTNPLLLVVAVIVAGALVAAGLLDFGSEGASSAPPAEQPAAAQTPEPAATTLAGDVTASDEEESPPATQAPEAEAVTQSAEETSGGAGAKGDVQVTVVLSASGGDCWLLVRAGSATGEILFEGTLAAGTSEEFTAKRLWVRMGAPENLSATIDGEPAAIPGGAIDVLVTKTGIAPGPSA